MHNNLFAYGNERDVYEALQRDFKRDTRQTQIMDLMICALVLFLTRHFSFWARIAAFAATVVEISRLNTFIDNSNRNFFMHMIDWLEARP